MAYRTWLWKFSPPSTAKYDKGYKKDAYESSGVTEYWSFSPGEKSVEVYRTDGTKLIRHFQLDNHVRICYTLNQ